MNLIVILFVILKSWIRGIKKNLITLIACIIGLIVSISIYSVYNTVQEQFVLIIAKQYGNGTWETNYTLTYDMPFNDDYGHRKGDPCLNFERAYAGDNDNYGEITIDSLIKYSKNEVFSNWVKNEDSLSYKYAWITKLYWDYQDNLWFMPHKIDEIEGDNLFESKNTNYKIIKDEINEEYLHFETMSIERVNYQKGKKFGKSRWAGGMLCIEASNTEDESINSHPFFKNMPIGQVYEAHWYSAYDISKLVLDFHYQIYPDSSLKRLNICHEDMVILNNVYPQPDEWHSDGFSYTDSTKIGEPLKLYLEFPKNASLQQGRNYVLSAIITLFFTLIVTIVYGIIKTKYIVRQKRINLCNKLCRSNKIQLSKKTYLPLIANDVIILSACILPIVLFNPLEWSWGKLLYMWILAIVVFILLISTSLSIRKTWGSNDIFYVFIYSLRLKIKILFSILLLIYLFILINNNNEIGLSLIIMLGIIATLVYIVANIIGLFKISVLGVGYFNKPKSKYSKLIKPLRIISLTLLGFIIFVEITKLWLEQNISIVHEIERGYFAYVEIILLLIIMLSYLAVKRITFRQRRETK